MSFPWLSSNVLLRNFIRVIIAFVIYSSTLHVTLADDKIQVVTENWYPYNYIDKQGVIVGKSTDFVKKILTYSGVDYSIEVYPWARAIRLATTHPNVLIYSILRTPNRENMFYWFCPIGTTNTHKIYKLTRRTDIEVKSTDDIVKYTIGVTRNTFLHQYMLDLGLVENVNLQINPDDALSTKLFFAGRVDLLADLESSMERTIATQGLDKSIVTQLTSIPVQHYSPNCMALSKQTPIELVNKIRNAHQYIMQP